MNKIIVPKDVFEKIISIKNSYQEGGFFEPMTQEMEDNARAPQKPIARILYGVQTNEVKEGSLPEGIYNRVDYVDGTNDYLTDDGYNNLKRMQNYRIYIEQQAKKNKGMQLNPPTASMQEGGEIEALASKYGIPQERVNQLLMQEGGQSPDQMQQVMEQVAQALQGGADPQEVFQQLVQIGIPEQQAQQLIQQIQRQFPQEGDMSNPQEEGQEQMMQFGGNIGGYRKGLVQPEPTNSLYEKLPKIFIPTEGYMPDTAQPQPTKTVTSSYTPQQREERLSDYFKEMTNLGYSGEKNIGEMQKWAAEKFPNEVEQYFTKNGQAMTAKHVDLIKTNNRDAFKTAGISPNKASASYTKEEKEKLKQALGDKADQKFWLEGFQDNKWDWRFPTLPLKATSTGTQQVTPQTTGETPPEFKTEEPPTEEQTTRRVGTGMGYYPFILPPSGMQPIAKPFVPLGRIEPIKQTVEPYLAEAERQRATSLEQLIASGLPPQIAEALSAQQLASGQLSANDAISKVEGFNTQNQFEADKINMNQGDKEKLLNEQFNQGYQDKMMQTVANQERDIRGYFNNWNDYELQKYKDNFNRNVINMQYENKQINPDGTIDFVAPLSSSQPVDNTEYNNWYKTLTPQEQVQATKKRTEETYARLKKQYLPK